MTELNIKYMKLTLKRLKRCTIHHHMVRRIL